MGWGKGISRRHGTPEERFWRHVNKTDSCWVWTGTTDRGYGRIMVERRSRWVHRFAYELFVGPIPAGLTIDHLCRNRSCVNPAHMEVVTAVVNTMRGECAPAQNARKTHCAHGHEYTRENTYTYEGARQCRACWRIRAAHRRQKRRTA